MIQKISEKLGVQQDLISLASLFTLNIMLCKLWRLIHDPFKRKLFSLVPGVFFLVFMLQWWALYVIVTGMVGYFVVTSQRKNPFLVSVFVGFGFLISIHTYRAIYDYCSWKIDCSVMQMFMTTKIIYLGRHLQTTKQQVNLFDFLSYALFFPGVLVGPTFSYETFTNFVNREGWYAKIQYPDTTKFILQGVFWTVMTLLMARYFPQNWLDTSKFYASLSVGGKIMIIFLLGIAYRAKFYVAWYFTQAAIDNSGISYDQKGTNTQVLCGSSQFEIEHNPKIKTPFWNTSVSKWIGDCFYEPLNARFPRSKSIPTFVSFICSALWHGIYPSYYIAFIHWALLTEVSKLCYKASHLMRRFENLLVYKVLVWVLASTVFNYVGLMVVILGTRELFSYLNGVYWFGTIVILGMYAFFMFNPQLTRSRNPSTKPEAKVDTD